MFAIASRFYFYFEYLTGHTAGAGAADR